MIEHDSIIPLYEQVADLLRKDIRSGVFDSSKKLPTEGELAEKYGISRITVRHAVSELVQEGLVERKQGKGTFICQAVMHKPISHSSLSFTELCEMNGKIPGSKLISAGIQVPENPRVISMMELAPGEEVVTLFRVRLADNIPCVLETSYYPRKYQDILKLDLGRDSVYRYLREEKNMEIVTGEMFLRIVEADAKTAELLKVKKKTPLMESWGRIFTGEGELLHISHQVGYGKDFEFVIR